jgi:dipeptidase E
MKRRLLLLSNSTNYGESFLAWSEQYLHQFLKPTDGPLLFIPYAAISMSWDAYYAKVQGRFAAWGRTIESVHTMENPIQAIEGSSCIVVGGGNTFHLLHHLQKSHMLEPIRQKVLRGTSYIGWSAGSNLACPTIKTTNDMPVIDVDDMEALNLVPFQINPHFTDKTISNHGGESRITRLEEFMQVNPTYDVIGLPEGMLLEIEDDTLRVFGQGSASVFRYSEAPIEVVSGSAADWLLSAR